MKKHGAILSFTDARNAELLRAYRTQIALASHVRVIDICSLAVLMPASRYWVSPERAIIVITDILNGRDPLPAMNPNKRSMFADIYSRYRQEAALHPDESLISIITRIIFEGAPRFYMSARYAKDLIQKIRTKK